MACVRVRGALSESDQMSVNILLISVRTVVNVVAARPAPGAGHLAVSILIALARMFLLKISLTCMLLSQVCLKVSATQEEGPVRNYFLQHCEDLALLTIDE